MKDSLDVTGKLVEALMEAAQTEAASIIEAAIRRQLERIQRDHLQRRTIKFIDAMGLICIWVDDKGLYYLARAGESARRPDWMTELHELIDWYCEMGYLAKVSINDITLEPLR